MWIYNLIRKLIIALSLIFYLSSLVIIIATLNIQFASDLEITGNLIEIDSFQAGSSSLIVGLDDVPDASVERDDRNEQEDLAGADQSGDTREAVLLATFGRSMFLPGQDIASMELSQAVWNMCRS